MMEFAFDQVENMVGNGENTSIFSFTHNFF